MAPHTESEPFGPQVTNDDLILQGMGYKPELKRDYNKYQLFAVCFSIMSLVPSIASTLSSGLMGGGVGLTWGWFFPCAFIMSLGVALAEFGSAMPTAGGLYWWTYRFAPEGYKALFSFFIGYADTLGHAASVGSINYGFATQLLSCPALLSSTYTPNNYETYAVFAAATILQLACIYFPNRIISGIQTMTVLINAAAVFIVCIALPVGLKANGGRLNSGDFVFGDTTNYSDWQYGWTWLLAWMPAVWTISSHDAAIHMAEEASNAPVAIPFAMISAIGLCWVLGFAVMCVLAAVASPDMTNLITTSYGNSMAAIIRECLGPKWAVALMAIFTFVQWCMGLSQLVATSRQTWAFARDDGLPFSRLTKVTHRNLPINSGIFVALMVLVIGLLILVNSIAAKATFSLSIAALQLSWAAPVVLRTIWFDPNDFVPGPFYLGHFWSRVNGAVVSLYSVFVAFVLTQMPSYKHIDKSTMNYTVVICVFVYGGSLLYWYFSAKHWFSGPVSELEDEGDIEVIEGEAYEPLKLQDEKKDAE